MPAEIGRRQAALREALTRLGIADEDRQAGLLFARYGALLVSALWGEPAGESARAAG